MTIKIRIDPTAFETGATGSAGPLGEFATKENQPFADPLQFPEAPLPLGTTGTTGAPGPGFIASASPLTFRSNIREDGTFPVAPAALVDNTLDVSVHVSPTSGSTIVRGIEPVFSSIEENPTYGLNVTLAGVEMQEDVFETAISEPVGSQFLANLQDLVARSIIIVEDDGVALTPTEIRDFTV